MVADLEAGVGTVSRLATGSIDRLVLVVEPTPKSIEVGRRALGLAQELDLNDVVVIASRVLDDRDVAHVRQSLPGPPVHTVPDDPAVLDADRLGVAPLDHAPTSPAVIAVEALATRLLTAIER